MTVVSIIVTLALVVWGLMMLFLGLVALRNMGDDKLKNRYRRGENPPPRDW